ncbi:MAG: hypothetical protein WAN23_09625 [Candidatus Acidiferrales bacterium]
MSIEKKSLISTLKTTKKANAVKGDITGATTVSPAQKMPIMKASPSTKAVAKVKPVAKAVTKVKPVTKAVAKVKPVAKAVQKVR